jgi:hypothetical protein
MHSPGPLPTSVSCACLFTCVERNTVSNSSYSRDPRLRLFPAFSSLVHFERKINKYFKSHFLKVMRHPGPLPASFSCARLFPCEERTKVLNSSFHEIPVCGSFRLLAPSCTSKERPKKNPEVKKSQRCASP